MEESIRKGASDFVYRNRLARLPIAVALAIEQRATREERDHAETKLRRSEAHYHALAGNPHYGIFRFDLKAAGFLAVNKALAAMLGYEGRPDCIDGSRTWPRTSSEIRPNKLNCSRPTGTRAASSGSKLNGKGKMARR